MKTAEEIIQQMVDEMPFDLNKSCKPYIREAMEIYAKQVAEQVLIRASEMYSTVKMYGVDIDLVSVKTILDTPIQLP